MIGSTRRSDPPTGLSSQRPYPRGSSFRSFRCRLGAQLCKGRRGSSRVFPHRAAALRRARLRSARDAVPFGGNLRGIHGDAVGMVLGELVVRDKLVQDLQHTVIGLAQFLQVPLAVLIKCPGRIGRDQQEARPHRQVGPGQ